MRMNLAVALLFCVLGSLSQAMPPSSPELLARVEGTLEHDDLRELAQAVRLLGRWKAPRGPAIERAMERLAGSLRSSRGSEVDSALEVLGPRGYRLELESARKSLACEKSPGIPVYRATLEYLAAYPADEYWALRPEVARWLASDDPETVAMTLKIFEEWNSPLTRNEIESLLRRGGKFKARTLDHLKKTQAH